MLDLSSMISWVVTIIIVAVLSFCVLIPIIFLIDKIRMILLKLKFKKEGIKNGIQEKTNTVKANTFGTEQTYQLAGTTGTAKSSDDRLSQGSNRTFKLS